MNEELMEISFGLIANAGEAKGLAYEALAAAENGDFEEAEKLLKEADEALNQAHKVQTDIIQAEARGENTEVSVLFVHAQDHLMTAIEARNLIEKMIKMYKIIDTKLANLK